MRISRRSKDIQGFQIISASNGQIIAKVEDVLLDLKGLRVAAIVTRKEGLLGTKVEAIPHNEIRVLGEDVILVSAPDVISERENLVGSKDWESVANQIKGKDVLNTRGERLAELDDVIIDTDGRILGFELSIVSLEGPIAETNRIHVNTTQALGPDALIIDTSKLYQWELQVSDRGRE